MKGMRTNMLSCFWQVLYKLSDKRKKKKKSNHVEFLAAQFAQSDFVAYIISDYPPALNVAGNHFHFQKARKVSSVNSRQKELQGATLHFTARLYRCNVQSLVDSYSKSVNHIAATHLDFKSGMVASSCVYGLRLLLLLLLPLFYTLQIFGTPVWECSPWLTEVTMTDDTKALCDIAKRLCITSVFLEKLS